MTKQTMTEIKQVFFYNNHIINAERSERLFKIETLFRNRREREGNGGMGEGEQVVPYMCTFWD